MVYFVGLCNIIAGKRNISYTCALFVNSWPQKERAILERVKNRTRRKMNVSPRKLKRNRGNVSCNKIYKVHIKRLCLVRDLPIKYKKIPKFKNIHCLYT